MKYGQRLAYKQPARWRKQYRQKYDLHEDLLHTSQCKPHNQNVQILILIKPVAAEVGQVSTPEKADSHGNIVPE
jgi:hypothetical protein